MGTIFLISCCMVLCKMKIHWATFLGTYVAKQKQTNKHININNKNFLCQKNLNCCTTQISDKRRTQSQQLGP